MVKRRWQCNGNYNTANSNLIQRKKHKTKKSETNVPVKPMGNYWPLHRDGKTLLIQEASYDDGHKC